MVKKVDRAKQFLPFAALPPLEKALREKEQEQIPKKELSDDMIQEISNVLQIISKNDIINIQYYFFHQYVQLVGVVKDVNYIKKYLLVNDEKVFFDNIYSIKIL